MGVDGSWFFYKIEKDKFPYVEERFLDAVEGISDIPEIPDLNPLPKSSSEINSYTSSWLEGVFVGQELSSKLYHEPLGRLAFQLREENVLSRKERIAVAAQPRVLPVAVLLAGIGRERFAQLPGHLGNMLLRKSEVREAIITANETLTVDWEDYFEKAKRLLDYAGDEHRAIKNVLDILHVIPKALETAEAQEVSLLALTTWGCI